MAITTYQCPKQQPSDNEEEARKARLEHNRRLLARSKLVAANVEANQPIALGTHTAAGTMGTESPASESIGNNTDDVPETNMKKDLVVTETKTTMDEAKTSNDAEEHIVEARGEEVPKEKPRTEKPRKPKPKETENGENQALSKKAEAKRKEGYNKFSLLLGIIEEAATEKREEKVEEAASKIGESEDDDESESEKDEEAASKIEESEDDESESEKDQDVDAEDTTWFGAKYSCEEMQLMQDLMAKIAEEAAAAEKKREKRKRKKKRKAEKPNGRKEEKPNGSYPSIGVLCLALVCIMVYSFI